MRSVALISVAGLLLFQVVLAQQDDGEGGPEDTSSCGPMAAEPLVHECHCAHMIDDFRAKYYAECKRKPTEKEREKCVADAPTTCNVMDHPANFGMENHKDQCKKKCVPSKCTCNEGACGPRQSLPPQVKSKKGKK